MSMLKLWWVPHNLISLSNKTKGLVIIFRITVYNVDLLGHPNTELWSYLPSSICVMSHGRKTSLVYFLKSWILCPEFALEKKRKVIWNLWRIQFLHFPTIIIPHHYFTSLVETSNIDLLRWCMVQNINNNWLHIVFRNSGFKYLAFLF
jgi:hypothetical protein